MPRPSVTQMSSLQYASAIRWDFNIITPPAGISIATSELNLRVYSSTIPKRTTEESTIENRGTVIWQPGITRYPGSITLGFHEGEDGLMGKFLTAWGQRIWQNGSGVQQPTNALKAVFKLDLLTSTDKIRETYVLEGCWLKDYDATELGSTGSDTIKYTVVLQYDGFEKTL